VNSAASFETTDGPGAHGPFGAPVGARRLRPKILHASQIPLLRRGHLALALLVFGVHLLNRQPSAWHAAVTVGFAGVWYATVRWTLLSESRSSPSWAVTVVRATEATLITMVIVLALRTALGLAVPPLALVATTLELGILAFLWQVAVAGHHSLGEPLRCVVIGRGSIVRQIERERLAPGARPFRLVGWLDEDEDDSGALDPPHAPRLGHVVDLERAALRGDVDVFVIGVRGGRPRLYARLLDLAYLDVRAIEFPAFFEREFGRVPLQELSPTWFLHAMHLFRRDESDWEKRLLDLTLAAVGLVVVAPVLAVTALVIRLRDPGPILFRQVRIGEHGRPFTMLKFRSMRHAPAGDQLTWTGDDDPRITPVGKVIRKFRIDELPQLLNVLRGDMSLVGPRPETPGYVEWLEREIPFYKPRHFAKPGITGWAQVCAGYAASIEHTREKLSYDLYYLRNRSLGLDFAIMLRTFAIVVGGRGAK
jgi:exopolysaccharide biosynthesis polyprenyl glycosylphosphotransferase